MQKSFLKPQVNLKENSFLTRYLLVWLVPVVLLIGWQLAVVSGLVSSRLLPAPLDVFATVGKLIGQGKLLGDIAISTQRALAGLLLGGTLGFVLGLLNGTFWLSEKLLDSSIQMLRTIPNLSLIPLVILWFGIGEEARLFLVTLGVFFPVYINTFHGVLNVEANLKEMGKVYGLKGVSLFWQIILPGALPSILLGLRVALGVMWLTLIVAETISANSGIGYMTMNAREFMQTDVIVLGILIYALLGKLADSLAKALERYLLKWNPVYQ